MKHGGKHKKTVNNEKREFNALGPVVNRSCGMTAELSVGGDRTDFSSWPESNRCVVHSLQKLRFELFFGTASVQYLQTPLGVCIRLCRRIVSAIAHVISKNQNDIRGGCSRSRSQAGYQKGAECKFGFHSNNLIAIKAVPGLGKNFFHHTCGFDAGEFLIQTLVGEYQPIVINP